MRLSKLFLIASGFGASVLILLGAQTKISLNQINGLSGSILESNIGPINTSTPGMVIPTNVTGCKYIQVFQNGLIMTITNDYTLSTDQSGLTPISVSNGDTFKFVCFK